MSQRPTITGLVAIAAVILTMWVIARVSTPVIRLVTGADGVDSAEVIKGEQEAFTKQVVGWRARIDGRSAFFEPPEPPPPPPEPGPVVVEREPPPPPPPARYGGPRIVAIIGDAVWFSPDLKLRVGEDDDQDLRVLAIDAPWSADVEWKGVEFTVEFFKRDERLIAAEEDRESTDQTEQTPDGNAAAGAPDEPGTEME